MTDIDISDIGAGASAPVARRLRLVAEFALLFIALPLIMALGLPASALWSAFGALLVVTILLLSISDGFSWRSLLAPPAVVTWWGLALFVLATGAVTVGLVLWLTPYALLSLPRHNAEMWLLILCLYPFFSALPQEIFFRALFFGRYGTLFPSARVAIAANAGAFSLAHLMFWNWPALVLTAAGGAIFAWAYREKRSFLFAWLLHTLAGQIIFTSGLGMFFYHGAV